LTVYGQSTTDGTALLNQYDTVGSDTVTNGKEHEIKSYQGVNYTYINDGRLTQVTDGKGNSCTLKYDALGRTVSRNLNGTITYYYYDGERPIQETNSAGGGIATNYWGIGVDEIVIRFEAGGLQYFFYQDHEGSVTHVRNQYNQLLEQYRYDAFGTPTIRDGNGTVLGSSAINNRFMFTGREWAGAQSGVSFGFYEYRARAYHPGLGRFMSEDPKGFDAGDYNLFRYCGNDPGDRTDPMGLDEVEIEFRAFIPQANVGPYRGDNRTFSSDRNASSRVSVAARVETDPSRNSGKPLVGTPQVRVQSTHNNLTGKDSTSNGPRMPQVHASRDKDGNTVVNIQMNMRNPEQHVGQGITSNVNISVNQAATNASVNGSVSKSPAFEANITPENRSTTNVPLQNAAQNPVQFIINLQETNDIHKRIELPPKNNQ
jgi:RHS repeat-associated protein